MLSSLQTLIESKRFEGIIATLIVLNAISLGLETSKSVMSVASDLIHLIDLVLLVMFTIELIARLVVYRTRFHKDPWRLFDLVVVTISWLPTTGGLSVLRALRILRVLRLVGVVPSLRKVVGGLVAALPGMGSIVMLMTLVFYVFSVMATKLFSETFPEWFGTIADSAYTLFQVMTLESWSMGIVRPVMEVYPYAWMFFIPFIMCTTFTVLNLFIGIIVSAMQSEHEELATEERNAMHTDQASMIAELKALREEISVLSQRLDANSTGKPSSH